jgi:hypothetical protein
VYYGKAHETQEREKLVHRTTHAVVPDVLDVVVDVICGDKQGVRREQQKNSRECCREKHEGERSE